MKYIYENLGPDLFQEFVQSLLIETNPDIACYPVGQADGGRDATLALGSKSQFNVYQVKYSRDPSKIKDVVSWLEKAIKKEMGSVQKLFKRGAKKYYLVTNVPGTSKLDSGTMDKVEAVFEKLGLENCQCLWRDDLDRRLDKCSDLRWTYPTLITGMDVIKNLVENGLNESQSRRTLALRAFLRTEFKRDEKVRFKQVDLQNDLLKLFIDVPIKPLEVEDESSLSWRRALISSVAAKSKDNEDQAEPSLILTRESYLEQQESVGTAQFLLDKTVHVEESVVVIEGGPGQGKSTLTQYISQVHRARLLKEASFLDNISRQHLGNV